MVMNNIREEYKEAKESISLQYLNQILINQRKTKEFKKIEKNKMIYDAVKKGDLAFFLNHIKAKVLKKSYYCLSGNKKYSFQGKDLYYTNLPKVAIYTCIIGKYDSILEPLFINPNTDQKIPEDSSWKKIDVSKFPEYNQDSPIMLNRKIKILSYKYLEEYDYSIYIDGNIQIVADLMPLVLKMDKSIIGVHTHAIRDCIYKESNGINLLKKANKELVRKQLNRYKNDGFPEHFGLFQNSILIRKHNSDKARELMDLWWSEYSKERTRDQLSLPYVIWKMSLDISDIVILGRDAYSNPRFRIIDHQ